MENQLCTSATVDFREDGTVQISNPSLQYAKFQFNVGESTGAYAIVPGEGSNPEGHATY